MSALFELILTVIFLLQFGFSSKIRLDSERSFQNMLVFIKDDVPEDKNLIDNIQKYFIEASKSLLLSTNNMDSDKSGVQFGIISIRVPMTWKTQFTNPATWHQCNNADVYITTEKENNYEKEPFTKQIGECGSPGEYTRYPINFFNSQQTGLRTKSKIMMREFVKQRYGVFSEKPYKNMLTVFDGEKFVSSTCGSNINWTLSKPMAQCSLMNNDCQYSIDHGQSHLSSVMFDQETESSAFFCDNSSHVHNKMAKSLHNLKCGGKSVSEIILRHNDFRKKGNKTVYKEPDFIIFKGDYRKIVLVIDSSESMIEKLQNVKNAAIEFILNVVEDTAMVGLVSFNITGKIVSPLLSMNDIKNKESLIRGINSLTADDWTNIPEGIKKALTVLGSDFDSLDQVSGTIILLTDGQNNEQSVTWRLMIPTILNYKGVTVHTISYGIWADENLSNLSNVTGGRFLFAYPYESYPDLMSKFAIKTFCENPKMLSAKIFQGSTVVNLNSTNIVEDLIFIDQYVGKNVHITTTFDSDISEYNILLVNPGGHEFKHNKMINENYKTTLSFKIPGLAEIGTYKMKLIPSKEKSAFQKLSSNISISYVISSTMEGSLSRVILPTGKLSVFKIERNDYLTSVTVTVDMTSCQLSASETASITLTMTDPQNGKVSRKMYDNGLGDDSVEGDQIFTTNIYSRDLNFTGFYTFIATIKIFDKTANFIYRTVDLDALLVKEARLSPFVDKIPPARINNIDMTILDKMNRILKITCIATGDDGLVGKISLYQIKINSSKEIIFTETKEVDPLDILNFDIILNTTSLTAPFTISIRGVDPSGNEGQWSPEKIFSWQYDEIWKRYSTNQY